MNAGPLPATNSGWHSPASLLIKAHVMHSRVRRLFTAVIAASFLWPLSLSAQDQKEITAARDRGTKYLKSLQKSDGHWEYAGHDTGITALCTIALVENGIPLEDDMLQKGYNYVKKHSLEAKQTYDLALCVVAISRFGDRRDKPLIRQLSARLMAGQMDSGGWHYTCPTDIDEEKVLKDTSNLKPKEGFGDNSCTQFAVLGLWVGSRAGVNIDKVLDKVSKRFLTTQSENGGWGYLAEGEGAAMTSAGLFCLAVAEAHRIRVAQKSEGKATEDTGVAHQSLLDNPTFAKGLKRTGDFAPAVRSGTARYFMWSIERVGVLLALEKFGAVEWYPEGSKGLLKEQREAGGWLVSGPGGETDKSGLADTSFALLFLRKANLGSDISRLLEGESDQKFEILGRKEKFNSLVEVVAAAKAGETVRINGNGPYVVGNLELKQDITIQAGFGMAPVIKFEVGKSRLGIRLRPETDVNARNMITVLGGQVTLEGLRLQMDAPTMKPAIAWNTVLVKGGSLRILNCTISEGNKQGSAGISLRAPGQLVVRNSLIVGGRAGIECIAAGAQHVLLDNSVIFSNTAFKVANDLQTKAPAQVQLNIRRSAIQAKEVVDLAKVVGKVGVDSTSNVIQADALGSNFLVTEKDKNRNWSGSANLYDIKTWIGASGKPVASIKDAKSWSEFWANADRNIAKRIAPFVGNQQMGNFTHEMNIQFWVAELPPEAESFLTQSPIGINAYLAGAGSPYDQYRETFGYTDWTRGELGLNGSPPAVTTNATK